MRGEAEADLTYPTKYFSYDFHPIREILSKACSWILPNVVPSPKPALVINPSLIVSELIC